MPRPGLAGIIDAVSFVRSVRSALRILRGIAWVVGGLCLGDGMAGDGRAAAAPPDGMLIAHWAFDTAGGDGVSPEETGWNPVTLGGMRGRIVSGGVSGAALAITGDAAGTVDAGTIDLGGGLARYSMAVWVKTPDTHVATVMGLVGFQQLMLMHMGSTVAFQDMARLQPTVGCAVPVTDGNWHHLAVTYAEDGQVSLYVDGGLFGLTQGAVRGMGSGVLRFGGVVDPLAWQPPFGGMIDDAQLYNFALSGDDVWYLGTHPGQTLDVPRRRPPEPPPEPVRIVVHPPDLVVNVGDNVRLEVVAEGSEPFTYSWRYEGITELGRERVLLLPNIQESQAGYYSVVVRNRTNAVTSRSALITVRTAAPVITGQPRSAVGMVGGSVTFTVSAVGAGPLTYYWYLNDALQTSGSNSSFTVSNLRTSLTGSVYVLIQGSGGSVRSETVSLTVSQPQVESVHLRTSVPTGGGWISRVGTDASSFARGTVFQIRAIPYDGYTFVRWGGDIFGTDDVYALTLDRDMSVTAEFSRSPVTLELGNLSPASGTRYVKAPIRYRLGQYLAGQRFLADFLVGPTPQQLTKVGVSRPFLTDQSAGYVESQFVPLPALGPNGSLYARMRAWDGERGGTYETALAAGADGGESDTFQIEGPGIAQPSPTQHLLVGLRSFVLTTVPSITVQPASQTSGPGLGVGFSVSGAGWPPPTYQWYRNGNLIPGATEYRYWIPVLTAADFGTYTVLLSNSRGTVTSAPAELRQGQPTEIRSVHVSSPAERGQPLTLSVEATGEGTLYYRWLRDGMYLTEYVADASEFQLEAAEAGVYSVSVVGNGGRVSRDIVTVPGSVFLRTVSENGTIVVSPSSRAYAPGTEVHLEAVPNPGFAFLYWSGAATNETAATSLTLAGDSEVEAHFTPSGGTVYFANRVAGTELDWPVFDLDGVTRLEGPGFVAQLYAGNTVGPLEAVGSPVAFRSGEGAGYFTGGTVLIPSVPGGGMARCQVRIWDSTVGADFAATANAGGRYGASEVFVMSTGNLGLPPSLPEFLKGLRSFKVRQEGIEPPRWVTVPAGQEVWAGAFLRLEAQGIGAEPLSYRWLKDGVPIPKAYQPALEFPSVVPGDAGSYAVELSNPFGVIRSAPVQLSVLVGETLQVATVQGGTVQWVPDGAYHVRGTRVSLTAVAEPGFVFSRWSGDVTGTNNPLEILLDRSVTVTPEFRPDHGTVLFGNRVPEAGLNAPILDPTGTQPASGPGLVAQLYAGPTGAPLQPIGRPEALGSGPSAGFFGPALRSLPTVLPGAMARVQVKAWDLAAGDTYEAAASSGGTVGLSEAWDQATGDPTVALSPPAPLAELNSIRLGRSRAPVFTESPASATVWLGRNVELAVVAEGFPAPHLQWRKGGIELPGATGPRLRVDAAADAANGVYDIRAINDAGEAISAPAILHVVPPAQIESLTGPGTVFVGETARLLVRVLGTPPLHFQWYAGDAGDESRPFGIDAVEVESGVLTSPASFWVKIRDAGGTLSSGVVAVSVERRNQAITFLAPSKAVFGEPPAPIKLSADSGLSAVCDVVEGPGKVTEARVEILGAGRIRLVARQEGNAYFLPAEPVERTIDVARAPVAITLAPLQQVDDGTPRRLTATTDPAGLPVTITYSGSPEPPTLVGDYSVVGIVDEADYAGRVETTLRVVEATWDLIAVVFEDRDGNGFWDVGEVGMEGVPLVLEGRGRKLTRFADGNGIVRFEGLPEGSYRVEERRPEGVVSTTPAVRFLAMPRGGYPGTLEFGNQGARTVQGMVYFDVNGNGEHDPGEQGMAGVVVRLRQGGVTRGTTTAVDGSYQFRGTGTGLATVEELDPVGFESTTPNARSFSVTAESPAGVSFGDRKQHAICGVVFEDLNGNGVPDRGEPGIAGVRVRLVIAGGDWEVATMTTGTWGQFVFESLEPGDYDVVESLPAGHTIRSSTVGLASSSSPRLGAAPEVVRLPLRLDAGAGATANFGNHRTNSITGIAFDDLDGDGRRGVGESGLAGLRLELRDPTDDSLVTAVTTSGDGNFRFAGLRPGRYEVRQLVAPGYLAPRPAAAGLADRAAVVVLLPNRLAGSVAGRVFDDLDEDRLPGPIEPGVAGVRLRWVQPGYPTLETRSSADGTFRFAPLEPGRGILEATLPVGFMAAGATNRALKLSDGGLASAAFALRSSAGTAPQWLALPVDLSVIAGGAGQFSAAATGSEPLVFQWAKDGRLVPGATNRVLAWASVAAVDAGSYTVTVRNAYGTETSPPAQLTVRSLPSGGYSDWAAARGLTSSQALPEADPDHDGVANVWEFLLGTSPTQVDPGGAPRAEIIRTQGLPVLAFVLRRSHAATGLHLYFQVSSDLVRWSRIEPVLTMITPGLESDLVRLLDPGPGGVAGARFVRLVVEFNQPGDPP